MKPYKLKEVARMNTAFHTNNYTNTNTTVVSNTTRTNNIINIADFQSKRNPRPQQQDQPQPQQPKEQPTTKAPSLTSSNIPVQPIVGDDIQKVKEYILNRPQRYKTIDFNLRDYTLFCFNINVGLRISDLLQLKISDKLINGEIVDYIPLKETKNKKKRELLILPEVKELLLQYINSLNNWQFAQGW